jgi:hypothetical protein
MRNSAGNCRYVALMQHSRCICCVASDKQLKFNKMKSTPFSPPPPPQRVHDVVRTAQAVVKMLRFTKFLNIHNRAGRNLIFEIGVKYAIEGFLNNRFSHRNFILR